MTETLMSARYACILRGEGGIFARCSFDGPTLYRPGVSQVMQVALTDAYILLLRLESQLVRVSKLLVHHSPPFLASPGEAIRMELSQWFSDLFSGVQVQEGPTGVVLRHVTDSDRDRFLRIDQETLALQQGRLEFGGRHPEAVRRRFPDRPFHRYPVLMVDGCPWWCEVTDDPALGVDRQLVLALLTGASVIGVPAWHHGRELQFGGLVSSFVAVNALRVLKRRLSEVQVHPILS